MVPVGPCPGARQVLLESGWVFMLNRVSDWSLDFGSDLQHKDLR